MNRLIYNDYYSGFYDENNFPPFMDSWAGAERVNSFTLAPTEYSSGEKGMAFVYHIQPQEVTLIFKAVTTVKKMGGETVRQASIRLCGRDDQMGEVEKIILDAEKTFVKI